MATSGVQATQECLDAFQALKRKQSKYIIFRLSDDRKTIIVEKKGESDKTADAEASYQEFVQSLPEKDCRWAVYDFHYTKEDEATKMQMPGNKLIFVSWSPDSAPIKSKLTYAASKEAIRRPLEGAGPDIQGTELSEIDYSFVSTRVLRP